MYVQSFELVLFFTFIIFMERGNNYLAFFFKAAFYAVSVSISVELPLTLSLYLFKF